MLSMDARRRSLMALAVVALIVSANALFLDRMLAEEHQPPLSVGYTEVIWDGDRVEIAPPIHNDGESTVELLSARAPGVQGAEVLRSADEWVLERDRLLRVSGLKIKSNESEWVSIVVPARCPIVPRVGTLEVRMRVDGRESTQVLQMPAIVAGSCR